MSADADGAARALREAFDAAFAAPAEAGPRAEEVALLVVRAGAARVALRALETGGLVALGHVEPVPSRRGELLGVTGLRGALLPVYGLARLLGLDDAGEARRWLVLAGGAVRVGLACGALEAYRRVPAAAVEPARGARGGLRERVVLDGEAVPVASVAALLREIGLS